MAIINVDGTDYNLKSMWDRSKVLEILKGKMKGCNDDYVEVTGDFKLSDADIKDINVDHLNMWWNSRKPVIKRMIYLKWFNQLGIDTVNK